MKQFSGSKCSTDPPAPPQTHNVKERNTLRFGHRPDPHHPTGNLGVGLELLLRLPEQNWALYDAENAHKHTQTRHSGTHTGFCGYIYVRPSSGKQDLLQ